MKAPKRPIEPYPPYKPIKPQPPSEEIEDWVSLKEIELSNYDSFSYDEFLQSLKVDKDTKSLKVFIDCEVEHGYYDDVNAKGKIRICEKRMIKNPSFKYLFDNYQTSLARYEKDKEKYDKDLKKYEKAMQEYKKALPSWKEYEHQRMIEYHEKELRKLKKK